MISDCNYTLLDTLNNTLLELLWQLVTYLNSVALFQGNLNTCPIQLQYHTVQKTHVFTSPFLENPQHLEAWD